MSKTTIQPRWDSISQQMWFPSQTMNYLMRELVIDCMDVYIANYNPYSWMQLTSSLTHRIHDIKGSTHLWQEHTSCQWRPTGTIIDGQRELTPTRVMVQEQKCYDSMFDSSFDHFIRYGGNSSTVELDENGERLLMEALLVLIENAAIGFRQGLAMGQRFDFDIVDFEPDLGTDIVQQIKLTANSMKGWVQLLLENSAKAGLSHLNVPDVFSGADFDAGGNFIGSVVAKYDLLKKAAKSQLLKVINRGSFIVGGKTYDAQIQLDDILFNRLEAEYREQGQAIAQNDPRISMERITWGNRTHKIYMIDNLVCVPMDDVSCLNTEIKGDFLFMAINITGNIALGGSFTGLPTAPAPNFSFAIQKDPNLNRLGHYYYLLHALASTQIQDTNYIVSSQGLFND